MNDTSDPSFIPSTERPFSVWLVSGWYFVSGAFSISMIAMVQSRFAAMSPDQRAAAPGLALPDVLLAALLIAINLTGAWFLFNLKKICVPFFYAALALNVISNVWYLIGRGAGPKPALLLIGVVMGWLVALTVCRFAASLARKGVLR